MRVLIVEDDENKGAQMERLVCDEFPGVEILRAMSYQSGVRALVRDRFDVVLLDMTMPTFDITGSEDGGKHQLYAGREILRQMQRRGIMMPVIVVTQFDTFGKPPNARTLDELRVELKQAHPLIYCDTVFYEAAAENWKKALIRSIRRVVQEVR